MILEQVSPSCYAVINEKNRLCDSNSGLINRGGGVVIDTQSDLSHARHMIELFSGVWQSRPRRVINTHEDCDHVWGNQLFKDAEIIGHRSLRHRMEVVADPKEMQQLQMICRVFFVRWLVKVMRPALYALGRQLLEDYDFTGIEPVPPTTLVMDHHELDLDGMEVHLHYVGPAHQEGDLIVHVPAEDVVFAGDILFRDCTPAGWLGTNTRWLKALDRIIELAPKTIVPGHGPVCGLEGVHELKAYFEHIMAESRACFDKGDSSLEAAKQMDLGPSASWNCPARIYLNVERAYREFRDDPPGKPWDVIETFQAIYQVARAKGIAVVF